MRESDQVRLRGEHSANLDESALWAAHRQGSTSARDRLFHTYQSYAEGIARRRYLDRKAGDIEIADLRQLAYAGLLEAIDHFDPERGAPFKAYAARRIAGSVLDGLAKLSEFREQISLRNRMRANRARSLAAGVEPDKLGAQDALEALGEIAVGLALGFMIEGTGLIQSEDEPEARPNAYETLAWKELLEHVSSALRELPERVQLIIRRHYMEGAGFDQIGDELGVSKGRISQLHKAALEQLRRTLDAMNGFSLTR